MPKWFPKVMNNGPKWSPGAPRINLFFVFMDFWRRRKTWFFDEVPGRPKNKENRPVERQRLEKSSPADNSTTDRSPGGSRHSRLRIKRRTTSRWSHTPKGRRPGEFKENITNESTPGILTNRFRYHKINERAISLVFLSIRQFCHTLCTNNILLLSLFWMLLISLLYL